MDSDNYDKVTLDRTNLVLILELRKALDQLGAKETHDIFSRVYKTFLQTEDIDDIIEESL